nr:hypothetical protein [Pseudomonas sp. BIGb0427]
MVSEKYGYTVHAGYPDGHTRKMLSQAMASHSTFPASGRHHHLRRGLGGCSGQRRKTA